MNGGTTNMERVRVEDVCEGEKGEGMGIMTIQQDTAQE
jgi:hypothetical protein